MLLPTPHSKLMLLPASLANRKSSIVDGISMRFWVVEELDVLRLAARVKRMPGCNDVYSHHRRTQITAETTSLVEA